MARFFLHVIHQQVLAEGVGCGEVRFASAKFGYFLHEVNQAVVAGKHECVDQDSGAAAAAHFFEGLRYD